MGKVWWTRFDCLNSIRELWIPPQISLVLWFEIVMNCFLGYLFYTFTAIQTRICLAQSSLSVLWYTTIVCNVLEKTKQKFFPNSIIRTSAKTTRLKVLFFYIASLCWLFAYKLTRPCYQLQTFAGREHSDLILEVGASSP